MTTTTNTATRAATRTAATTDSKATLKAFSEYLTGWQSKICGAAPTAAQLDQATALGLRTGSKKAFAAAMYMRDGGATQGQVIFALGGPQLNVLRDAVNAGVAKRVALPAINGHTVYKMALPAKGAAKAKGKGKADKPATAKGKAKATPAAPAKAKATRKPAAAKANKPAADGTGTLTLIKGNKPAADTASAS